MMHYDVCVIGGGLAGTAACAAITPLGLKTILIERASTLAQGASGNMRGLIVPYITTSETPVSSLYEDAYLSIQKELDALRSQGHLSSLSHSGALQFPSAHRPRKLLSHLTSNPGATQFARTLNSDEVASLLGFSLESSVFYYPDAAIISPPELCSAWMKISGADVILNSEALSLSRKENCWIVSSSKDSDFIKSEFIVIANAFDCCHFTQTNWLKVEPVRGQILIMDIPPVLSKLKTALCYDGYALPTGKNSLLLGASYDHNNMDINVCDNRNIDMIKRFERWIPSVKLSPSKIEGRVSFRTSTHDRMPYVGAVPDFEAIKAMKLLWSRMQEATLPKLPNLFVSAGHGSRGLLSAHLSAQIIADKINSPEMKSAYDSLLEPARLVRQMIKREELL